jgi:hypothetical protein
MKQHLWKSILPLALSFFISIDGLLPAAYAQTLPARIDIVVVEGEGASSGPRQRVSRDPVVRIEDDDHRPVAGATVTFALPISGTSGEFLNGAKTYTAITGADGTAAARGIRTNDLPGKLQIYVTAVYQSLRARTLINQIVEGTPRVPDLQTSRSGGGKWKWILLGIAAGGGAGAGVYFGTRSNPSPVSISTGTVVFGSPR